MSKLNRKFINELKFTIKVIKSFRFNSDPFICSEQMVLLNGVASEPAPQSTMRKLTWRAPGYCYSNSYKASIAPRSKWIYNEGFAITGVMEIVFAHAWLTREDEPGVAFDPTWETTTNTIYLGIPFRKKYIIDMARRSCYKYYPVIYAPWNGSPLLTGEHKLEEAVHETFLPKMPKMVRASQL